MSHQYIYTSNLAYKFFNAHLKKYTGNSTDFKLCRMDLFDSGKIHFEIFCQVLLTSIMISEILQEHHKHFSQFLTVVEGSGALVPLHGHKYVTTCTQKIHLHSVVLALHRKHSVSVIVDRVKDKG